MKINTIKPIEFKEQNTIFAKDQKQYNNLPSHRAPQGKITSCWSMTILQRLKFLLTGKFYLSVYTYNEPLQPVSLSLKFEK